MDEGSQERIDLAMRGALSVDDLSETEQSRYLEQLAASLWEPSEEGRAILRRTT